MSDLDLISTGILSCGHPRRLLPTLVLRGLEDRVVGTRLNLSSNTKRQIIISGVVHPLQSFVKHAKPGEPQKGLQSFPPFGDVTL
jgi:hypothetical protein